MYITIVYFEDLEDNRHAYHVGDIFPHDGMTVSKERLEELSTDKNRRHIPLIEKVPSEVTESPSEETKEEVKAEVPEEKKKPRKRAKKG